MKYILEIEAYNGDDTSVALFSDGEAVDSLWCILVVDASGAHVVDSGYRSFAEAKIAWPDAIGEPDTFRCDLCGGLARYGVECPCKS